MYEAIQNVLKESAYISIISDIWTNKQMLDFMGLAVCVIDHKFQKKTLVIGMKLMPGAHNADNIAIAIQNLVNAYTFDKNIIIGVVSDEGSAYVRLFKQKVIADDDDGDDGGDCEGENGDDFNGDDNDGDKDETLKDKDSNLSIPYSSDEEEDADSLKTIEEETSEYQSNLTADRQYFSNLKYEHNIELSTSTKTQNVVEEIFDESEEYCFKSENSAPLKCFKINLGTADCPRLLN